MNLTLFEGYFFGIVAFLALVSLLSVLWLGFDNSNVKDSILQSSYLLWIIYGVLVVLPFALMFGLRNHFEKNNMKFFYKVYPWISAVLLIVPIIHSIPGDDLNTVPKKYIALGSLCLFLPFMWLIKNKST